MRKINCLAISAALILCALGVQTVDAFAESPKNQNYVWFGEVVMYDEKGKTVTVDARYREHINRYIGEFKIGDRVMLNWATPRPGETEAITYVGRYDASAGARWGYVLPVEFVSADTTERRLRFTVPLPSKALKALKRIPSGGWIKVTTPFDQPHETAAIVAVEPSIERQGLPSSGGREEQLQEVPQV
jgi:hypothetical protein